jgi:hypothetical protein
MMSYCMPVSRSIMNLPTPTLPRLSLRLLVVLEHLLDNLLLLDEECADDAVLDTSGTSRSSVCALNGLLWLGEVGVLSGTECGNFGPVSVIPNSIEYATELESDSLPESFEPQSPQRGALPFLWMCRYLSSPPGVLMMRVLFERAVHLISMVMRL